MRVLHSAWSLTSRLSLTMMSKHAMKVARRAAGAANQKSCGDPNQQMGVMRTAQRRISLQGVSQGRTSK